MFERYFNRCNTHDRGSRSAAAESARAASFCDSSANNENMTGLLILGTALAVSIFVALSLIVIRLVSLILAGIAVLLLGSTVFKRPCLVSAH